MSGSAGLGPAPRSDHAGDAWDRPSALLFRNPETIAEPADRLHPLAHGPQLGAQPPDVHVHGPRLQAIGDLRADVPGLLEQLAAAHRPALPLEQRLKEAEFGRGERELV